MLEWHGHKWLICISALSEKKISSCGYKTKYSQLIIFMNRIINIFVKRPKESSRVSCLINECLTLSQGVLFLPSCHPFRAIFKRLGGQITNITEDKGSPPPSARCELREMPERTEPGPRISRSRGRREGPVATHLGGPGALSP